MCRWIDLLRGGGRITLLLVSCIVLVGMIVWSFHPTETVLVERAPVNKPLAQAGALPEQKQLQSEIAALGAQSEHLRDQLRQLQKQVTALQLAQHREPIAQPGEPSASPKTRAGQQEAQLAMSSEDQQNEFALLEERFYAEPLDAQWAATMQLSLQDVEARLSEQTHGDTYIEYQECRSTTCRVEFAHHTSAPALLPALIASPTNSAIVLQSVVVDGIEKTIALYQR